ncbi:DUF3718 domain-containing protein [Alteromonas sp. ALT199]|uniref:DUF3718 domain-containing protein n=1 Tax=unclassified Alteromonas TaxID=2614992 RepID=UPI00044FA412|nr:DUF3718 domain-containing protein [Alteromonas sp. ALT199]MBT3133994.1 DUF3718 domain-containing protein [Alteromonas sp. ALT199]
MKSRTTALTIIALTSLFTGSALASVEFTPSDDSVTSNLCVTAASGNKWKFHNQIKASALDKKYVAEEMTCNGLTVSAFVDQYGENGDSIKKYLNIQQQHIANVAHTN